ncbi:SiaB family protein kinase [Candidatus Halobeggiatoa sp. HSG11]|nr:SiaB family protein kinase [Candidatus Halobeggiatoa sp. HSG11]
MLDSLLDFKKECDKQGILISFYGFISQELLVEVGHNLKSRMELERIDSTKITKIFAMFVEQTQNIVRYSAEKVSDVNGSLSNGIIIIGYKDEHYFVLCGNKIKKNSIEPLTKKLSILHSMDKNELKSYYKEQRKKGQLTTDGAGLGFIELARKSTKPIDFNFQAIDEQSSFFSLKTYI